MHNNNKVKLMKRGLTGLLSAALVLGLLTGCAPGADKQAAEQAPPEETFLV